MTKNFISPIHIITAETYPTYIRNTAVSASQSLTRIGAVIVPYINILVIILSILIVNRLIKSHFKKIRVKFIGIQQGF
jgi:hypothetical protein